MTDVATEAGVRQVREATVRRHYEAENRHADAASVREMWQDILAVLPRYPS